MSIDSGHAEAAARADDLARRLDLPFVPLSADDAALRLVVTDAHLELRHPDGGPVYCEFVEGAFGYRVSRSLRNELLARAIGFRGAPLEVVDMTAGLGRDAVLLALLGCRVTAIERSPVVHALLEDGLRRAARDPEMARALEHLTLVLGDACEYLERRRAEPPPDAITLDPMFPPRGHAALPRKEMRTLARLLGEAEDTERLLRAALAMRPPRVVLKRPLRAPVLAVPGAPPPVQYRGRSARFDVYFAASAGRHTG